MWKIVSSRLGMSVKSYETKELALTASQIAWSADEQRVGEVVIIGNDVEGTPIVSFGGKELAFALSMIRDLVDYERDCQCDNRACECNLPAYL